MFELVHKVLHGVERLLLECDLVLAVGTLVDEPLQDRALAVEQVAVELASVALATWKTNTFRIKSQFIFVNLLKHVPKQP